MSHPGKMITVRVDAAQEYQSVDGFGVNINSKSWGPNLMPAMDMLLHDLGATLYRVDIWGKSNWIDPSGSARPGSVRPEAQARIYSGEIFQRGWSMMRWLNEQGIQPYLTASGDVPRWMLGPDGKTLTDIESFTDMLVGMVEWARKKEKINFRLFGPLNETDLGSPEGPTVPPEFYVTFCERLSEKLDARGLKDIQLVVAEQAHFNASYLNAFARSNKLHGRIGAFGMHTYSDLSPAAYKEVVGGLTIGSMAGARLWMTEYGDLDQSGEREWFVAWAMTSRLFDLLEAGFNAALVWDAYDNYHDHDEAWTIYGLLRTGLRVHTPKKRYYASKQVFRFVQPGFQRIGAVSDTPGLRVLAFTDSEREQLSIVGLNDTPFPARLNVQVKGFEALENASLTYFRTSETENCQVVERVPMYGPHWPFTGVDVTVPPASIITLTTRNG